MLRNVAYGGLALVGGAITGIVISSWATPLAPPINPEVVRVATVAQQGLTLASTSSRVADQANNCSPWDVSDVAMEAALNEMIRRGWRPPSQAEIIASFDSYGNPSVQAVDPQSPVPVRYPPSRTSTDESLPSGEPFPLDQIQPPMQSTPEGALTPVTPPVVVAPPAPTVTSEGATPPSN